MANDLLISLRLSLQDGGVEAKVARAAASIVGLRREVDKLADSGRSVRQRLGDGMDSISRQLASMQRLAQSAFLIFQGAGLVGGIARAAAEFESLEAAMRAVFGSAQAASSEMQRLRAESERLGVPLQTLAPSWLSFAAAARGTALEGEAARDVFTALTEASVTLGLSQEQLSGALLAVQQMISKGAVSSEELRQQLGERLYGAVQIAARSVGLASDEFNRLLERGLIPVERFLPAFAAQLRRELGGGVTDASNTARAAFARLENSLLALKLEFARSGFMDALVAAAKDLSAAFRDPGFRASVREFGATMGALTRFVVEHGDKLVVLGGVLTGARLGAGAGRLLGPKGAVVGAVIGGVAGGIGADSLLPGGTASGEDEKRVMDVEAAVTRLKRRIEDTRKAAAAGLIKPEEAKARIAADEARITQLTAGRVHQKAASSSVDTSYFRKLADAAGSAPTRLPHLAESFDAELSALKAALKTSEDVLEASFKARLVKEDAYWQAKGAMQRQALDLEARDLAGKIADQERLIAQLKETLIKSCAAARLSCAGRNGAFLARSTA
ncbi:MAG: tape measure protein, partial [Rhodocyclaceae bacterium]|nr:tape measure protein [Rhodocyclaceae bacterium]